MHIIRTKTGKNGVWLSLIALTICYFFTSIPLRIESSNMQLSDQPSAFMYSLEPILFGGVIQLFPFCACLPGAMHNRNRYGKLSPARVFTLGSIATALPFIIHTIVWNILALPSNPAVYSSHELQMFGLLNDLYGIAYGIPVYVIFTFGMILCGGSLALVHQLCVIWLRDQVAAFIFPAVLYFGWLLLSIHFTWLQLPAPMDLFDEGLTIRSGCILMIIYAVIIVFCSTRIKAMIARQD
ncbi:MAG: hypothetical protein IJL36_04170 [Clostridia bacterium]|nr:hypothetical protein [Clostridia bacterium]